jgi:hypothetical protein
MPRRIVDGEAIWLSDKIGLVEPPQYRAEFATLVPLMNGYGTFECSAKVIWAKVYTCNRPDITLAEVAKILDEYQRVGLLFRWEENGKVYGHWVGSLKPGRLPARSERTTKEKRICEKIPTEALAEFMGVKPDFLYKSELADVLTPLKSTLRVAAEYPPSSQGLGIGDGNVRGNGYGYGVGVGSGNGSDRSTIQPSPAHEESVTDKSKTSNPEPELEVEIEDAIKGMVDSYPREPKHSAMKKEWVKTFRDNIILLASEYFADDRFKAVNFVIDSLNKFIAKHNDPTYSWAPKKFFSDWVFKEHALTRLQEKQAVNAFETEVLEDVDQL